MCGELCKSCHGGCHPNEASGVEIECVGCDGSGKQGEDDCEDCDGHGFIEIDGCPRKHAQEVASAVNLAAMAEKGMMPIAGGILDQSSWFIDLWQLLGSEKSRISSERIDRARRG